MSRDRPFSWSSADTTSYRCQEQTSTVRDDLRNQGQAGMLGADAHLADRPDQLNVIT